MNNVNTPLSNCIAGVSGGSNIAELWREKFSELLNCISDTTDCHCCYTDEMVVSVNEVNEGISRLECNKACGLDGVSAEHLKHCSSRVTPLLAQTCQVSRIPRESHGFWQFLKAHGRETQCSRIFVNLSGRCPCRNRLCD